MTLFRILIKQAIIMRANILILFLLLFPTLLFSQNRDPRFHDNGVIINGVRWATRNVGTTPGTFADTPEDFGGYFQWNRRTTNWANKSLASVWQNANNPCPQGWRVPTSAELEQLFNLTGSWTTRNGVNGRLFGRIPNQIFLPAAGFRINAEVLANSDEWGVYWSSTQVDASSAWDLRFNNYAASIYWTSRYYGLTIRCVSVETHREAEEVERRRLEEERRQQDEQARRQREAEAHRLQQDQHGVIINGVRWATRNVASPGTFTARPEDAGMLFQWNRRRGWTSTGANVDGWNNSPASGTSWSRVNDPCPPGWRVPTSSELALLMSSNGTHSVRQVINGVEGRLFGNAPNQIFLPAVGQRFSGTGALSDINRRGGYWSSTQDTGLRGATNAVQFWFTPTGGPARMLSGDMSNRATALSIRCVAE